MIAEFKKIGSWEKVAQLTKGLNNHIRQGAIEGQLRVAKRLEQIVQDHLIHQDLKWKKLNPTYQQKKKANKDMILVERWKYYEAIKVEKRGDVVIVGVRKDRYYVNKDGSRIALFKVAAFHESGLKGKLFGKYSLPARPLWGPSMRELTKLGVDELIAKELRKVFKEKGWGTVTKKQLTKYKAPI